MVTELAAGGGETGNLGGRSVGVARGVPIMAVGVACFGVPIRVGEGVVDLEGVREGRGVGVFGPG